jgi:hypothetical protein
MSESKQPVDPTVARALWLAGAPPRAGSTPDRTRTPRRRSRPRHPVELFPREPGRPLILMSYAIGDYVVPTDLPRQFLCRVTHAHPVGNTPLQVLELAPLEGPWPMETRLVRGGDSVRPAAAVELAALRRWHAARAGRGTRPRGRTPLARRRRRSTRGSDLSDAG